MLSALASSKHPHPLAQNAKKMGPRPLHLETAVIPTKGRNALCVGRVLQHNYQLFSEFHRDFLQLLPLFIRQGFIDPQISQAPTFLIPFKTCLTIQGHR